MQFKTLALLGLSALGTALPTANVLGPIDAGAIHPRPPTRSLPVQRAKVVDARSSVAIDARDGRAATIYKSAGAVGESTFIPANDYCTNISVVPGGFDGKIKSLSVEKGAKCDFYQ